MTYLLSRCCLSGFFLYSPFGRITVQAMKTYTSVAALLKAETVWGLDDRGRVVVGIRRKSATATPRPRPKDCEGFPRLAR